MEPLSKKIRTVYLVILTFIFIVLVPITLLYSSGYRLGEGLKLVKTGGIYIGLDESNALLYLDGKLMKEAGILKNGFFVQNLTPRVYHIVVKKEGYRTWEKVIEVLPQRVSETSSFILQNTIPYTEILASENVYAETLELFATSSVTNILPEAYPDFLATSTRIGDVKEVKRKGDVVIWKEGETIYARWVNDNSNAPSYFCNERVCDREIILNKELIEYFDFHPQSNELLLFVIDDVVVMTEIDPRIPRNEQALFKAKGVKVRTQSDSIFISEPIGEEIKIFEFEL